MRCAPRCGTRAPVDRGLPVLDEPPVGKLGLGGEFFVEPVLLLAGEDADWVALALVSLGAEHQLEPAQLLACERWAGEGVVLAVAEHVPGDHGELAGDGDGGDVAAAAGGDPFVEGAQRSGRARGVPGRFDQHVPGLAGPLLGDPPVPGRLGARLAHARVEAEIADQVTRGREATDLTDRGDQRRGGDEVHPGQSQQPPHLPRGEHLPGERTLDQRDLGVEERDLAQADRDRLLSSAGKTCSASQRRPRTPNRSLTGGFRFRLRISVACTWFFARVRCRTSCARSETRRRRIRVCSSGSQTSGKKPPESSLASVRASILSVFAPACVIPLTAFGFASTTRRTCCAMMRAIPSALPVASSATSSSPARLCANSASVSGSVCPRPASRTSPLSAIATSQKSRWTSNPIKRTEPPLVTDGDGAGDTTTTD